MHKFLLLCCRGGGILRLMKYFLILHLLYGSAWLGGNWLWKFHLSLYPFVYCNWCLAWVVLDWIWRICRTESKKQKFSLFQNKCIYCENIFLHIAVFKYHTLYEHQDTDISIFFPWSQNSQAAVYTFNNFTFQKQSFKISLFIKNVQVTIEFLTIHYHFIHSILKSILQLNHW